MEKTPNFKSYDKLKLKKSILKYTSLIDDSHEKHSLYLFRGMCFKRLKKFKQAKVDFLLSIEFKEGYLNTKHLGDSYYYGFAEVDLALKYYQRSLEIIELVIDDQKKKEIEKEKINALIDQKKAIMNKIATIFHEQCEFEKQDEIISRVLEIDPSDTRALFIKSDFLYSYVNDFESSLNLIEMAYQYNPFDLRCLINYSFLLFEVRRKEEFKKILKECKNLYGDTSYYYLAKSKFKEREEKWEECLDLMNKSLKIEKKKILDRAIYFSRIGITLAKLFRFEEGEKNFKKAYQCLKENDGYTKIVILKNHSFFLFDRAKVLDSKEREIALSRAKKCIEEMIKINPKNPMGYNLLGIYKFDQRMDFKGAIDCFNKALSIVPNNSTIISNLGSCYQRLSKFNMSIIQFEKAIELNKHLEYNYNYLGEYYFNIDEPGSIEKSKEYMKKAISLCHSPIASYYYDLGTCLQKIFNNNPPNDLFALEEEEKKELMKKTEHYKCYQKAIDLLKAKKQNIEVFNMLGNCYFGQEKFEEAINCYDKAICKHPYNYLFHQNKANCYSFMEKYDEAIEVLRKGLTLNPSNINLLESIGYVYNYASKWKESKEILEKLFTISEDAEYNKEIIESLFKNCKALKDTKNMIKYVEMRWKNFCDKTKDWALNEIGDYFYEQENKKKAAEYYKKALKIKIKEEYLNNIRACYDIANSNISEKDEENWKVENPIDDTEVFEKKKKYLEKLKQEGIDYFKRLVKKIKNREFIDKIKNEKEKKEKKKLICPLEQIADQLSSMGEYPEAFKIFEFLYEHTQFNRILHFMSNCKIKQEKYDESYQILRKIQHFENFDEYQLTFDLVEKCLKEKNGNNEKDFQEEIVSYLSEMIEKNPKGWLFKHRAEYKLKLQRGNEAIDDYLKVINYCKESMDDRKKQEILQENNEEDNRTLDDLKDAYNSCGIIYFNEQEYLPGIEMFKKACEYDPNNHVYHYNMAFCYRSNGDLKESMDALQKCHKISPTYHESFNMYALIAFQQDKFELGVEYFGKAIESLKNKNEKNVIKDEETGSVYYRNRALCYKKLEKYTECLKDYCQTIELEKEVEDKIQYYFEKINVLIELKEFNDALNDLLFVYNFISDEYDYEEKSGESEKGTDPNNIKIKSALKEVHKTTEKIENLIKEEVFEKEIEKLNLGLFNNTYEFQFKEKKMYLEFTFESYDPVYLNKYFCHRLKNLPLENKEEESNFNVIKESDDFYYSLLDLKKYIYGLEIDFETFDDPIKHLYDLHTYSSKFGINELQVYLSKKLKVLAKQNLTSKTQKKGVDVIKMRKKFLKCILRVFKDGGITSILGLSFLKVLKTYFEEDEINFPAKGENEEAIMMLKLLMQNDMEKIKEHEEYIEKYQPKVYFNETLLRLKEKEKEGFKIHYDLYLVSNEEKKIGVIKDVLLVKSSEYFVKMLTLNSNSLFLEANHKMKEIHISVDNEVLEAMVQFFYSNDFFVVDTEKTVNSISKYLTGSNKYLLFNLEMVIKIWLLKLKTKEFWEKETNTSIFHTDTSSLTTTTYDTYEFESGISTPDYDDDYNGLVVDFEMTDSDLE